MGMRRERRGPWLPEEDQTIFDFVEKFGPGNGKPEPVPKMWARQYLEYLEEAEKKENMMEETRSNLTRCEGREGGGEKEAGGPKKAGEREDGGEKSSEG